MRKIFVFIVGLFFVGAVFAVGENVPTSKSYVDTAIAQKQDTIPANAGAAQVLTNTGTPGNVNTKNIYDSSAAYAGQTDALVDAQTMNAAVQNAIESEFVCIERDAQGECLLLEIRSAPARSTLPTGYTQLEYLEGQHGPYINTQFPGNNDNLRIVTKFNILRFAGGPYKGIYYDGVLGNYDGESRNVYRILTFTNKGVCIMSDNDCNLKMSLFANGLPSGGAIVGAIPIELNKDYALDLSQTGVLVNGRVLSPRSPVQQGSTNNASIRLFAGGANGGSERYYSDMRIYYFYLYNGVTLVRNMIPARRDSDNELGMYDTVTNTFFTNAGTGEFIAGPVFSYLPAGN